MLSLSIKYSCRSLGFAKVDCAMKNTIGKKKRGLETISGDFG